MDQQIKKYLNSRFVLFGISIFNFVLIWFTSERMQGIACAVCPWFYDWSYSNEPTLLLIASIALLINRRWSYLWAMGIPGYMVVSYVLLTLKYNGTLFEGLFHRYQELIYVWDTQYLLALLLLTCATVNAVKFLRIRRSDANIDSQEE